MQYLFNNSDSTIPVYLFTLAFIDLNEYWRPPLYLKKQQIALDLENIRRLVLTQENKSGFMQSYSVIMCFP